MAVAVGTTTCNDVCMGGPVVLIQGSGRDRPRCTTGPVMVPNLRCGSGLLVRVQFREPHKEPLTGENDLVRGFLHFRSAAYLLPFIRAPVFAADT